MPSNPNHPSDQRARDAFTNRDAVHDAQQEGEAHALDTGDIGAEPSPADPGEQHPIASRASVHSSKGAGPHLLFGSVEDLLDDLRACGAPDGNVVRVERLVRTRVHQYSGTATLGVALTARRGDEILSAWVVVARVALDPWGQPVSRDTARQAGQRHRDVQRTLAAFVADAGFVPRDGLYLLTEECYGYQATAQITAQATAATVTDHSPSTESVTEAQERTQVTEGQSAAPTAAPTEGDSAEGDFAEGQPTWDATQAPVNPGDTEQGDEGGDDDA